MNISLESQFEIVILAAGKGTRMKSEIPKPLILLNNKPIIQYLLDSIKMTDVKIPVSIVVSPKDEGVFRESLHICPDINYIMQTLPLGTGDAFKSFLQGDKSFRQNVLVLLGDHPFISSNSIRNLMINHIESEFKFSMLIAKVPNYLDIYKFFFRDGRIIRDSNGKVESIMEPNEITEDQMNALFEINPSVYAFNVNWSKSAINQIQIDLVKQEYYLTHLVKIAFAQNLKIGEYTVDALETFGINTPEQLTVATDILNKGLIKIHAKNLG